MGTEGIVRNIDSVGRVVIPKEIRRCLGINFGDELEIITSHKEIILRKHEMGCTFCGSRKELVKHRECYVCSDCIGELKG